MSKGDVRGRPAVIAEPELRDQKTRTSCRKLSFGGRRPSHYGHRPELGDTIDCVLSTGASTPVGLTSWPGLDRLLGALVGLVSDRPTSTVLG
jgi:hypothetical protein